MSTKNILRLLLIEDNPGDAGLVQEYLKESRTHSFQVKHCVRISEALKWLEKEKDVDIILSDVGLPDSTGIETFRKLHNAAVGTPLVFMTGTIPDEEAAIQALKEGAQDYLVKGQFASDLLIRSIRYAIERKKSDIEREELIKEEREVRNQLEIKKKRLELEIIVRKKLEKQKDEFIAIASHELKTPVTTMKAYAQMLEKRLSDHEDAKDIYLMQNINKQTDRLTNLINDLLNTNKLQAGKLVLQKKKFDLDAVVAKIVVDFQFATETHQIIKEGEIKEPVYGDQNRIDEVITNLITNAIKYSPKADRVIIRLATDEKNAIVSVQDFGFGIDKRDQVKVFERFHRTIDIREANVSGFGLGLYIAAEYIKAHHGKIWVESTKGKGSTFYFTLPLKKER